MKSQKLEEKVNEVSSAPRPPTFEGLRDILFEEINLVRAGKVPVSRARVVSQLAKRVIEASTLDLYAQLRLGNGTPEELKRLTNPNVNN